MKTQPGWAFLLLLCVQIAPLKAQLLWEVSGKNLHTSSYLFGTLHAQDERVYQLNDSVLHVFQKCQFFACEVLFDEASLHSFDTAVSAKKPLNEILSDEDYTFVIDLFEETLGLTEDQTKQISPFFLSILLTQSKARKDRPQVLDQYLQELAQQNGMSLHSLETMEDQLRLMRLMPLENSLRSIRHADEIEPFLHQMIDLYTSENLDQLLTLMMNEPGFSGIMDDFLYKRNEIMVAGLVPLMEKGGTFVAVGAAHLPGESGIIDLLRQKGYTVNPIISSSKSPLPFLDAATKWIAFQPEGTQVSMLIPKDPAYQIHPVETAIGSINTHIYTVQLPLEEGNVLYGFTYIDYPEEVFAEADSSMIHNFLIGSQNGAIENIGGKLISSKPWSPEGHPGRRFLASFKEDMGFFEGIIYFSNNRSYILQVISVVKINQVLSDKFFDSFAVKPE